MLTPAKGTQLYTVAIAGCVEAELPANGDVIAGGQTGVTGSPGGNFFSSHHGFIGGGRANCIDSSNGATTYGTIAGGELNTIAPGTNHASILGGAGITVSGSCSAILGGSGNNDGRFAYAGIFGQNVNGVMPNAFHTEELVLTNIPVDPVPGGGAVFAALPAGALYTTAPPLGPFLSRPIYVK